MRRWFLLALLVVAAPLSAQVPGCKAFSVSRTVSGDSVAFTVSGKCRMAHDTVTKTVTVLKTDTLRLARVDTVRVVDTVKAPPVPVDTAPTPPPATVGNRPASYTKQSVLDFSQAAPAYSNVDAPIVGSDGWATIYNSGMRANGDGTWTVLFPAGAHGSPTSGWGVGQIFRQMPERPTRLYAKARILVTGPFHPISNKFLNIECSGGVLLLMQLNEGGQWRHAEQLVNGGSSFWVDPGNGTPGQVSNAPITTGVWHDFETVIDLGAKTWRIWDNGVLTTDAKNLPFACTSIVTVGWNAFRGGGGETLTTPVTWRLDQIDLAW